MQVKCPKCRLRFDVPAPEGITEVQCNCPRCGTPFTYIATNPAADHQSPAATEKKEEEKPTTEASPEAKPTQSQADTKPEADGSPAATPYESHANADKKVETAAMGKTEEPAHTHSPRPQTHELPETQFLRHRQGTSLRGVLFAVAIIVVMIGAAALVVKGVDSFMTKMDSGAYMPTSVADSDSTTTAKEKEKTTAKAEALRKTRKAESKERAEAQKEDIPAWLQGRWEVNGGQTDLTMRISGTRITVSDAFHTTHGHITYSNGRITCHLTDGRIFVYIADTHRHHIIAGDGTVMTPM